MRERGYVKTAVVQKLDTLAAYTGTYSTNKLEAVESVNFIIIIIMQSGKQHFILRQMCTASP